MSSKLVITYEPGLIDEAIKEHLKNHMGLSGDISIDYVHRRKTRKVTAFVSVAPREALAKKELTLGAGSVEDYKKVIVEKPITFEDLPEHEKQEAMGLEPEDVLSQIQDDASMFADSPDDPELNNSDNVDDDLFDK